MPSKIHNFRASSIEDAMSYVRRELGSDAMIQESKEIVEAGVLEESRFCVEAGIQAVEMVKRHPSERPSTSIEKTVKSPRTIRTLAETMSLKSFAPNLFREVPEFPVEGTEDELLNDRFVSSKMQQLESVLPANLLDDRHSSINEQTLSAYHRSIASLQALVTRLECQSKTPNSAGIPAEFLPQFRQLIEADVEEAIAHDLIAALRHHQKVDTVTSPASLSATLRALIEREMRCAPPLQPQPGRREIVTLVGPTGVGKTTTIAKLAGHFHLRAGLRVGLITVDNYRVGAIEQLQTYADIMQIPLRSAANPDDLRNTIDEFDDVDMILIDTAGRNPLDDSKMNELRQLVCSAASNQVLLVLSLAAGPKMISRIADQFKSVAPSSLILTKLDETPDLGGLISIARNIPHPVRYISTGQEVPDNLEPAHPNRLAKLILGLDSIHMSPRS